MPSCWVMLVLVKYRIEEAKRILEINVHVIYSPEPNYRGKEGGGGGGY